MKKILTVLVSASLLVGCGDDGGGGGGNNAEVGYLTLSGIRGLSYETASQSGMTDEKGTFRYYPGETITFRLNDLVIAENVPTKRFLSPVDFDPTQADALNTGTLVSGLKTHKEAEALAAESTRIANITSFLAALDDDRNQQNGIQISDDVLEQIETVRTDEPIDFSKSGSDFGNEDDPNAPENRFVWALCFPEQGDAQCNDPLEGRTVGNQTSATRVLKEELDKISVEIGKNIFLTPFTEEVSAGDQSLRTFSINVRPDRTITDMEAISTDNSVLQVQNFDPVAKQVTYFAAGPANTQASVIVNIKLEGDYRWFQKSLNVRIQ